ncbi:MAG: LPXTG cell wall anchor domain-containing protein [Clostridiaceae bacterium]|nr:LPXTG cell wall anchor domain-containing protein [Clostridiaceae bacterium]
MKKLFCLILTLIMVLTIGSISFADSDLETIDDNEVPEAVRNVDTATYDPEITEIEKSDPEVSPGLVDIDEEEVPLAPALPNTGGIPAEAFYVAGALFVLAALILALKKNKAGQKE